MPGLMNDYYLQTGPKSIRIGETKQIRNRKTGYTVSGIQDIITNGYSFASQTGKNNEEFGFIDYEANVKLRIDFGFQ